MQLFSMHALLQILSLEEWDFWLFLYKKNKEVCLSDLTYLNNSIQPEIFSLINMLVWNFIKFKYWENI